MGVNREIRWGLMEGENTWRDTWNWMASQGQARNLVKFLGIIEGYCYGNATMHTQYLDDIYVGSADLNTGPHICTAYSLDTEPSP